VIVLEGLKALLASEPGIELVASCSSGEEVPDLILAHHPDIVILDYMMEGMSGIETLALLRNLGHECAVILLTGTIKEGVLQEGLRLGLGGIVLKESAWTELVQAIHSVHRGHRDYSPEVTERIATLQAVHVEVATDPLSNLTPREREVVAGVAAGQANKRIASELGISEGTVKLHLHSIFRKLNVRNRVQLILRTQESGRTPPPGSIGPNEG
jgi:two-component system nitrate/nitrite response regulator NarP